MSFDGEFVTEREHFQTVQAAWEHDNDMGSRWFFYPFRFVVTGETIKSAPDLLEHLQGKRIKTVQKIFNTLSNDPAMANADVDQFAYALYFNR